MKVIHILASQIWFGAVVCIFGFSLYCFNNMDTNNFLVLAPMIPYLYSSVALPAALVCIIQGILYGFFSQWGFIKHNWIKIKWLAIPFLILCTGMGGIGQMFTVLENVKQNNPTKITMNDGKLFFVFIILQILILGTMTIVSVLKPRKKNQPLLDR